MQDKIEKLTATVFLVIGAALLLLILGLSAYVLYLGALQ